MSDDPWLLIEAGLYACRRGRVERVGQEWWAELAGKKKRHGPFRSVKDAKAYVDEHGKMPKPTLPERVRKGAILTPHPVAWAFEHAKRRRKH